MADIKQYKHKYPKAVSLNIRSAQGSTHRDFDGEYGSVLIKVLNNQKDIERRKRMHREFTNLKTLEHPSIPVVYLSNTEYYDDIIYNLFIVMEFVDGSTVSSYVSEKGAFNLKQAINFFLQLLDVIEFCHDNGVVHRDLKPDNIILRNNNTDMPVMVDFGLSFNSEISSVLTQEDQILGNRFLALPELGKHSTDRHDIRSDITMAVGLLFYVITKIDPGNLIDQNGAMPHQRDGIFKDDEVKNQLEALSYIFDRGFQQKIEHRFQSINSLRESLEFTLRPKVCVDDVRDRLSFFLEKELSAHNIETINNEQMFIEIVQHLREAFLLMQRAFNGTVELILINRQQSATRCCYAYSINQKLKAGKMADRQLEANLIGDHVVIIGGPVELHGSYVGETVEICRVKKGEYKNINYKKAIDYLIGEALAEFSK